MTFARLIELARWGSAMDNYSTLGEYEEIHDFAKTWHDLLYEKLDDIELCRPSTDVQPVRHGTWLPYLKEGLTVKCSECGSRFDRLWHYCPSCGATMRGERT